MVMSVWGVVQVVWFLCLWRYWDDGVMGNGLG